MKFIFALIFPFLCHAEATYVCVAQCGFIHPADDSVQGMEYVQVIGSGVGKNAAFTNLESKCVAIQSLNPHTEMPLQLSSGFVMATLVQSANTLGLAGQHIQATPGTACTELPSNEARPEDRGDAAIVLPTPHN